MTELQLIIDRLLNSPIETMVIIVLTIALLGVLGVIGLTVYSIMRLAYALKEPVTEALKTFAANSRDDRDERAQLMDRLSEVETAYKKVRDDLGTATATAGGYVTLAKDLEEQNRKKVLELEEERRSRAREVKEFKDLMDKERLERAELARRIELLEKSEKAAKETIKTLREELDRKQAENAELLKIIKDSREEFGNKDAEWQRRFTEQAHELENARGEIETLKDRLAVVEKTQTGPLLAKPDESKEASVLELKVATKEDNEQAA